MDNDRDLRFAVLGPVRAFQDGTELPLGGPQQRAFLAALLAAGGRGLPMDRIVAALWGDDPPARAVGTVRTYASRLRRVLERDRSRPEVLLSDGDGYALLVPDEAVDARVFEAAVAEAGPAESPAVRRDLLDAALEMWAGVPLTGVPGPDADAWRTRLSRRRLDALLTRLDLDLSLGRHAAAVAELGPLAGEHPLDERVHALLMTALYRCGRQAEALAAYTEARRVLAAELGVRPGPELTGLHQRILRNDPSLGLGDSATRDDSAFDPDAPGSRNDPSLDLDGSAARDDPSSGLGGSVPRDEGDAGEASSVAEAGARAERPVLPRPAALPADLPDFTGRAALADELARALTVPPEERAAPPVVGLSGVGGVGKTALAVHVAHAVRHAYPDGQLYVDLQGVGDRPLEPCAVLAGFLRALGVPEESVPDGEAERAALLRSRLADRRVLMLLDNARDAAQLRPLLPGGRGCAVLVTARARQAGLPGARNMDLDVLDPVEAIELFAAIAGRERVAADRNMDLDVLDPVEAIELFAAIAGRERVAAERAAVVDVVGLCGLLPLAVRIVAARLAARPSWTVAALSARLADGRRRLAEMRIGPLAVEATFRLGHDQLDPARARAFRLLSLPDAGVLSAEAATAALGEDDVLEVEDVLESLVDLGLLDSPAPGRYRYHDLLRLFARQTAERLDAPAARTAVPVRLLTHLLTVQRAVTGLIRPGPFVSGVAPDAPRRAPAFESAARARAWTFGHLDTMLSVVRQVAREGTAPATAADLLFALDPLMEEGYRWCEVEPAARALADCGPGPYAEGRASYVLGRVAVHTSRLDDAGRAAGRAAELAHRVGDTALRVASHDLLAHVEFYRLRPREAAGHLERALVLGRELGDRAGEMERLASLAYTHVELDEPDRAIEWAEDARALARELGYGAGEAYALHTLGMALDRAGRLDEAVARYDDALAICWSQGLRARESYVLLRLAETQLRRDRPEEALATAGQSLAIGREIGEEFQVGRARVALGRAHAALGDTAAARACWTDALDVFTRLDVAEAAEARALLDALEASRRDS
ncbi:SARP family transcriptional regulator [Actinomadura logoneensis]|uniref:SARP family transcriptional regulator n=1 Tax=Actinomadura logoneensis TaxID=2293572 RepID=A0A372JT79_9ACTN|nr:BTAD domain-containing putative transcriptional regulator [Actinomadura logoneensis]RFU43160.1 SARP family transcriptional regulator [Actinomadura logoneensis]